MRSLLFAPATRPDMLAKLGTRGADAIVIDLEDAVPAAEKAAARAGARAAAVALAACPARVYVRVNPVGTEWFADDLAQALPPEADGVVVPKIESASELAAVRAALSADGLDHLGIVLGLETAGGVHRVDELLDGAEAAYFGAEDFIADMGGVRTTGGHEVLYARSRVALAARCHGVPCADQAFVALDDDDGFTADARAGRAIGYRGKICIHPRQVALAHAAFSPSADEVDRARRLLDAWDAAGRDGVGALAFEGQMVDEPAVRMARSVLALAEQAA